MTSYNPLFISPQWLKEYHTKYPHGLSVMENLIDWVNQVNDLIDWVNITPEKTQEILTEWRNNGTLETLINEVLFTSKVDKGSLVINVEDFGAVSDYGSGNTDSTAAVVAASLIAGELSGSTLLFPKGPGYCVNTPINIPRNINVDMKSPLVYMGTDDTPFITVGQVDLLTEGRTLYLAAVRDQQSTWDNENSIGIRIYNANSCDIKIRQARKFTIGCQCIGDGSGFVYNDIVLYRLLDNKVPLDLASKATNGLGWVNENTFYNGRFMNTSSLHLTKSRYGVRIRSIDGVYKNNNNNVFYKPSFEIKAPNTGEAIPILIDNGNENHLYDIRSEGNGNIIARFSNESTENTIEVGYGLGVIEDLSANPTNTMQLGRERFYPQWTTVFTSGNLGKKAKIEGSSVSFDEINICTSTSGNPLGSTDSGITINSDHVSLTSVRGISVRIDTTRIKRFNVRRALKSVYGRVGVAAYNAEGSRLSNADAVKGSLRFPPIYNAAFGGIFRTGSDHNREFYFEVGETVAYIDVILHGSAEIEGFTIESYRGIAMPYKV